MKNQTPHVDERIEEQEIMFSNSNRAKITGYYCSGDGLCSGIGESGKKFVDVYEKTKKEQEERKAKFVFLLRQLGVTASHPDDGWHDRNGNNFGLAYPYHNDGVKVGDMVALGNYDDFVVVKVEKISGWFSKKYHYKNTIR